MLSKAEANLAAVDRLSEEVIAQKDEQHRKAIQELECAKNNVHFYLVWELTGAAVMVLMVCLIAACQLGGRGESLTFSVGRKSY